MSLRSLIIQVTWSLSDRLRDWGLTAPAGLVLHKNLSYGPQKEQLLDLYLPENAQAPCPTIVHVHGGGWVYGDKELYRHYCMDLATRGFAVVNFTYRLSPAHRFPCHLEDTALAFQWVRQHGAAYGLDLDNLFAAGDSAGAQILALYCCHCTNPTYAAQLNLPVPPGPAPRALALNCGVYDLIRSRHSNSDTLQLIRDVLGHRPTEEELRFLSPVTHINGDFPACYVMTANEDFLKDQPQSLAPLLQQHRVPHEFHCFGDDRTRLGHVFHLAIRRPPAIVCNDAECAFFRRHLRQTGRSNATDAQGRKEKA